MEIDKFARAIANGDTAVVANKVPFLKAKDVAAEFETLSAFDEKKARKKGDALLRKILTSLAKGRADDQKAVAETAIRVMEAGWYGSVKDES